MSEYVWTTSAHGTPFQVSREGARAPGQEQTRVQSGAETFTLGLVLGLGEAASESRVPKVIQLLLPLVQSGLQLSGLFERRQPDVGRGERSAGRSLYFAHTATHSTRARSCAAR